VLASLRGINYAETVGTVSRSARDVLRHAERAQVVAEAAALRSVSINTRDGLTTTRALLGIFEVEIGKDLPNQKGWKDPQGP